jgi:hypothetical protein
MGFSPQTTPSAYQKRQRDRNGFIRSRKGNPRAALAIGVLAIYMRAIDISAD